MNTATDDSHDIDRLLRNGHSLLAESICLQLLDYQLGLRSNSAALLERIRRYFSHVVVPSCDNVHTEVITIDSDIVDTGLEFTDWKREAGKTGRKDAIHDVAGGRLVQKVRTGMLFLQSRQSLVAAGPCLAYDNQVINFINSQFLNWLQNDGYLLCHAAALSHNGHGLAIAGLSGGGKSTLMLNLLENEATSYVTNDRLLVRRQGDMIHAVGIPKMPRINPGTIVNNPRLSPLIDQHSREALLQLDRAELWKLEQKYDADIAQLYGPGRIQHETTLQTFLVLNWQHDTAEALKLNKVELAERPDLLAAIMKPSGPFYVDAQGHFNSDDSSPDASAYRAALDGVDIYEASGQVDFEQLARLCLNELIG
jgi:HprK-related kinase B